MSECNIQFQQNLTAIIHDLKNVGRIAGRHGESDAIDWFLKHTFSKGSESERRRSKRCNAMKLADVKSKLGADSRVQQPARSIPLLFPTWTIPARRYETDEDLLKLFRRVEINILLLDAIKQVPKYAKFLNELCIHKGKKMKGRVETGGTVSALTKHEDTTARVQ
ncbi:hypothetical protein CR513_18951, partial [Mucuna pruriens]